MKSTGITRRIDELGRVVLPIEIRRNMDIKEGDQLEIHVDGDMICLRKYDTTQNTDVLLRKLKAAVSYAYESHNRIEMLKRISEIEVLLQEDRQ